MYGKAPVAWETGLSRGKGETPVAADKMSLPGRSAATVPPHGLVVHPQKEKAGIHNSLSPRILTDARQVPLRTVVRMFSASLVAMHIGRELTACAPAPRLG